MSCRSLPAATVRGRIGTFSTGNTTSCGGNRCVLVHWPGFYFLMERSAVIANAWHGSLLDSKADEGGLLYRRNRYFDPMTGRFTQADPIGLAGGLSSYGYAEGDPISYNDPYGLLADTVFTGADDGNVARQYWSELKQIAAQGLISNDPTKVAAGRTLSEFIHEAETSTVIFEINVDDQGEAFRALMLGGEVCGDGRCRILMDHTRPIERPRPLILAHELAGAILGLRGIIHRSPGGAIIGENAVRTILGCQLQTQHAPPSHPCP